MEKGIEEIQETIQTLLERLGCSGTVDFIEYTENVHFNIHTKDGGLLIGENGERLRAFNHIIRRITEHTSRDHKETPKFFVDVNDYQKQKIEELKDLARLSVQRVRYFKKEVSMQPMSAYERRIIHATLTECPDVITQSTGEEPERYIVIKPL